MLIEIKIGLCPRFRKYLQYKIFCHNVKINLLKHKENVNICLLEMVNLITDLQMPES